MGERGPVPKPTALRVLEGNPGHRTLNINEPRPRRIVPKPPSTLSDEAKVLWKELAPTLFRTNLLTEIDGMALAKLCEIEVLYRKAKAVLDSKGLVVVTPSGYKQIRPEVSVVNRMIEMSLRYYAQFGMTPAARARISVKIEDEGEDDEGILS